MSTLNKRFLFLYAIIFGLLLTVFFVFILLDAFVIPHDLLYIDDLSPAAASLPPVSTSTGEAAPDPAETELPVETVIIDTSYIDDKISINITTERTYDTDIYIAGVIVSDSSYFKAGLAGGGFGRNLRATTSEMAEECKAIFAVNGDYYGYRDSDYLLRNGIMYRRRGGRTAPPTRRLLFMMTAPSV